MFRSPLVPIFLTVFVDVLGLTLMLPLLPYYAEHFGASAQTVGFLTASYAVCQLISGPILGGISDRVGRKPVLLVSQCGTFAALLMLGFATRLEFLFIGRMIDGLTAGNLSIAQAYISDVTRPENRTKAFALIGIAFGSGFLIGPAISGTLAHRLGYSAPVFAAAALSLSSIVLTALFLPANPRRHDHGEAAAAAPAAPAGKRSLDFGRFFRRPEPRRHLLQFFAFVLSFSTLTGGLALFLERQFKYNPEQTGLVYAFSGLVGGLVQGGLIGRLVKRIGEEKLTLIGFVAMAIAYALLGFTDGNRLPLLVGLIMIAGFGAAVNRPSITTMLTRSVHSSEQGAALGLGQSLSSIAQIVGPITAGFLIQRQEFIAYGFAASSFAVLGALLSRSGPTAESLAIPRVQE